MAPRIGSLLSLLLSFCVVGGVSAQAASRPRAAVLGVDIKGGASPDLADGLGDVLRARVDEVRTIQVGGTPALKLSDLQLLAGCIGETESCLRRVAEELQVESLLVPELVQVGQTTVFTVLYLPAPSAGTIRRSVRRASGSTAQTTLIESVDGMVRELFALPEPAHPGASSLPSPLAAGRAAAPAASVARPSRPSLSPVPFVTGGLGLGALTAAVVLGIAADGNENDYQSAPKGTMREVDRALSIRQRAHTQATAANILFATAGAMAVATGVLCYVLWMRPESQTPPRATVAPMLDSQTAGVIMRAQMDSP